MALTPSIKDCHGTFDCRPFCVWEVFCSFCVLAGSFVTLVDDVHVFKVHRHDVFLVAWFWVGLSRFFILLMSSQRKLEKNPDRNHSAKRIQRAQVKRVHHVPSAWVNRCASIPNFFQELLQPTQLAIKRETEAAWEAMGPSALNSKKGAGQKEVTVLPLCCASVVTSMYTWYTASDIWYMIIYTTVPYH